MHDLSPGPQGPGGLVFEDVLTLFSPGGPLWPPYETFLDSISAMKNVTLKLLDF